MEDNKIDISGLNKAEVLKALFQKAKPIDPTHRELCERDHDMQVMLYQKTNSEIVEMILKDTCGKVNGIGGRILAVNLSEDTLDPRFYNRQNGANAAEKAILELRTEQNNKASL